MARGTVVGEAVVSQAQSKAWDENADRIGLGKSESAKERGVFVWDPKVGKLVRPWEREMDETAEARSAPIMVDRFYEGVPSPRGDGVVFQSRRQHREYMKAHNLTTIDDFNSPGGQWDRAAERRKAPFSDPKVRRERRDAIGRRLYEVEKMSSAQYERVCREVERRRRERGPGSPTE